MIYFICGGAGFIGSHLVHQILNEERDAYVIIYDNFSSGKMSYLEEVKNKKNIRIVEADIKESKDLVAAMKNVDIVYHFASNPDISKAMIRPDIDFWEGTYLTSNVLEVNEDYFSKRPILA